MNTLCSDNFTTIASYLPVKDLLSFLTSNKNFEYCNIIIPGYKITINKDNLLTFRKSILKMLSSRNMDFVLKYECIPSGMINIFKEKYQFYNYESIKYDLEESNIHWTITDRKMFLTDYIHSLGLLLLTTSNICCNELTNINPVKKWYNSRCCVSINLNQYTRPDIKFNKIHKIYRCKMIGQCKDIIVHSLLLRALIY